MKSRILISLLIAAALICGCGSKEHTETDTTADQISSTETTTEPTDTSTAATEETSDDETSAPQTDDAATDDVMTDGITTDAPVTEAPEAYHPFPDIPEISYKDDGYYLTVYEVIDQKLEFNTPPEHVIYADSIYRNSYTGYGVIIRILSDDGLITWVHAVENDDDALEFFWPDYDETLEWDGFTIMHDDWSNTFVLKDGEVVMATRDGAAEIYGNLLLIYFFPNSGSVDITLYGPGLTPLCDKPVYSLTKTPDGVGGITDDHHFTVWDTDGNVLRVSREYDKIYAASQGYILVRNGDVKLIDSYENEVAVYEGIPEETEIMAYSFKIWGEQYSERIYFSLMDDENNLVYSVAFNSSTGETSLTTESADNVTIG